jgi:aerobic-type carbon monoxide dehydrogenase small subunit (CoxS/CutS family)
VVPQPGLPGVAVPPAPQPPKPGAPAAPSLPLGTRKVTLEIDGGKHEVLVDVRESLWETMTNRLGMVAANLGCDRAQCGACTVVVDGRAVNGCTVLTARLGRGQKILTVAGLAKGPGVEGLHPIQRAFWQEGGYQCGICTRGFIMSTYALLQTNMNPSDDEIAEALSGNICRCGEYVKIFSSVKTAAAEMRGEKVTYTAPASVFTLAKLPPAAPAPAAAPATSKEFQFATPLATIEEFEPLAEKVKQRNGILEVSGSERTITIKWDPARLDEAAVRRILEELGRAVR